MNAETKRMAEGVHQALKAEIDGYHFYLMAARSTDDAKGKETFQRLANDELIHARFLKTQYAALTENGALDAKATLGTPTPFGQDHPIFSEKLTSRLADAHYEMSALSIGMQLELQAIQFYKSEADAASDIGVKTFFNELATWEKGHYDALSAQHSALKEDYWSAGGFSPF